jgi:hypothetical protein
MSDYKEWANKNLSVFTGIKPKYIPKKTMSEFKYGDMVEVRDSEKHNWDGPRFYLGSIPLPDGKVRYFTMYKDTNESNFEGGAIYWNYVRKHEPALTIEERLERIEAAIAKLQKP